jgi:hypothetical protein
MPNNTSVWINMQTAPRDQVESAFKNERDKIYAQIIQLDTEIRSANENRFPNDPIEIEMHFELQLGLLNALPQAEQTPIRNIAWDSIQKWQEAGEL